MARSRFCRYNEGGGWDTIVRNPFKHYLPDMIHQLCQMIDDASCDFLNICNISCAVSTTLHGATAVLKPQKDR